MNPNFPKGTVNQIAFLDGKVLKSTLPAFESSPPANSIGLKRLRLAQGELANFYDDDEGIRYAALIELRVGRLRGNHVHRVKVEQLYLISGEVLLAAQDGNGRRVSVAIKPGELVRIETGIAHVFSAIRDGSAIEFSSTRFDPTDAERVTLLS